MKQTDEYKIVALFGKSGSGKNYLQSQILKRNPHYHKIIPSTTRPPRQGEQDGIDYHFLSVDDFTKQILNFSMLEATCFNNWFYGTSVKDLDPFAVNIGVFSIAAIDCLLDDNHLNIEPILIGASDKTRLIRQLNRENDPNCSVICRRFLADGTDFKEIPFEYKYVHNDFSLSEPQLELNELIVQAFG